MTLEKVLEKVTQLRVLGMLFDEKPCFTNHISTTEFKA